MKSNEVLTKLRETIPNPVCELNYSNNYELMVAVLLSAQTTDKRVNMVTPELFRKYPNFKELKSASIIELINIIKSLGLANNKAKNLIMLAKTMYDEYNMEIKPDFDFLTKLPGIGRKTANVILALGFNIPAFPVDTHVNRVAKRLGLAKDNDDILTVEEKLKRKIPKKDWIEAHHLLLLFGRYYCTAKNSKCSDCKLIEYCKKNAK